MADQDNDRAGGITNRPLPVEVENQEQLPERGTQKTDDVLNRSTGERYDTPRRYEEEEEEAERERD